MCGCLGEAGLATDGLVRAQSSNSRLLATVITVIAAAMAILVLRLGIPSDLLPHTACLPGSASHPPRARPECGETAKEVWREPATAEADIPEVVAALGSTS